MPGHPPIVAVHDTGEDMTDGRPVPYIVIAYVGGTALLQLLHERRVPGPEREPWKSPPE